MKVFQLLEGDEDETCHDSREEHQGKRDAYALRGIPAGGDNPDQLDD